MSVTTLDSKKQEKTGSATRDRERRGDFRRAFTGGVTAVDPASRAELRSHTTDLSHGGCFVDTMNPFPLGTELYLRITQNSTSFHAKARVVYCKTPMGMGIVFTEIDPLQLRVLEGWLAEDRSEPPTELTAVEIEKIETEDNPKPAVAPRTGESRAIEELVAVLTARHVVSEDEGEAILVNLRQII